jgi:hypothetical protein
VHPILWLLGCKPTFAKIESTVLYKPHDSLDADRTSSSATGVLSRLENFLTRYSFQSQIWQSAFNRREGDV